ncbi:MAG: M20 family metallopeptidase [Gammaproteobacteria bacterium]|nr:M20 family metallopeptidase [Gammaproteobacteria bacterium]MYD75305.1 M20 family metallopeptidase [Gammaproteobacteria bacterium]MYJ51498.1 M20 family metallopeptidase [Gammaproteobacteria bacterium]
MREEDIADIVEQIDEGRLVERLAEMINIPSVNPFDAPAEPGYREREFAMAYRDAMEAAGLDTSVREVSDGRPNVFGRRPGVGEGPTVMLAGHLDTVGIDGYQNPFDPVVEKGRVYGRGSCDMKAGLAAFLEVATVINDLDVKLAGDLVVAGVIDEEYLMAGSRDVSVNGPSVDFAIIGEPTDLRICHAHKGQLCLPIRTFGRATHSSLPENGTNAIVHMSAVIRKLEEYARHLTSREPHPLCRHGRVNPGVIRGGTIASTVPDFCELMVDRRTLPGETRETVMAEWHELLEPLFREFPDLRIEFGEPVVDNPPLDTPADSPIVEAVADAFRIAVGETATIAAFPAATDAPNYRCHSVVCGPGSVEQAHSLNEYVEIEQLVSSARIYLGAVLKLLG